MTAQIITIQVSISIDPELISILRSLRLLLRMAGVNDFLVSLVNQPVNDITLTSLGSLAQHSEPVFGFDVNTTSNRNSSQGYNLTIIIINYQYDGILQ